MSGHVIVCNTTFTGVAALSTAFVGTCSFVINSCSTMTIAWFEASNISLGAAIDTAIGIVIGTATTMVSGAATGTVNGTVYCASILCVRLWPYHRICWCAGIYHHFCVYWWYHYHMGKYLSVALTCACGVGITSACSGGSTIAFVIIYGFTIVYTCVVCLVVVITRP